MKKLLSLSAWLISSPTGLLLVTYAPRSWICRNTAVEHIAWNPTTDKVLIEYWAGNAELWDITGEQPEHQYRLANHTGTTRALAYAPNGKTAISVNTDGVYLWDMQSGKLLYTLQDYTGRPTTVTYAPDSKTAVSGDYNGRAFLWDIQSGSLLHTFRAHTSAVSDIAYSPDGRTLLTSGDGKVILWELYSGVQLHTWQAHGEVKATDGIRSIAYSPDGNTVLAGYLNNTTFLWDIKTGNLLHSLKGSIVAYSPDGKTLLTVGPAMLWDMQSGTLLHTLSNPGTWSRAYSPDGKTILIGCDNGLSLLWDVHSGALLHKLPGLTGIVENVAYSPDGTMALTAPVYISNGGPALLWDVQNGTFLRPLCPLALGKVWLYTGWILCFTSGIVALFYLRQAISITSNKKRKTLHYKLLNCHLLKWRLN